MIDQQTAERLSDELYEALTRRRPIPLLSRRHPDLTVREAYDVSRSVLDRRISAGEKLVGKKIGLTAVAVQEMLSINEPDYGFLTDAMQVADGAEIHIADSMLMPLIEAEIAFVMRDALPRQNVTAEMVLAATEYVSASFELVDTRFDTQKIDIVDTVADNASAAKFLLGATKVDPRKLDLAAVGCSVLRNGEPVLFGKGEAVMGSPQNSVAWLANKLGSLGIGIEAGDVVLPGSLVPFLQILPGDHFAAEFSGIGRVSCSFT